MSNGKAEAHAAELHRQAIVIDGHSDILVPITDGKMRLADRVEVPNPAGWEPPMGMFGGTGTEFNFPNHAIYFGPMGQYDVPRFLEGTARESLTLLRICRTNMDHDQTTSPSKRRKELLSFRSAGNRKNHVSQAVVPRPRGYVARSVGSRTGRPIRSPSSTPRRRVRRPP